MIDLSVVVPMKDEQANVEPFFAELLPVLEATRLSFEVIAVDDGSSDGTFEALRTVHAREKRLRVIRFRRNFGQTAAFTAGFDAARGRRIVTIDADLQNDPADIPALLARAAEGFDVVSGFRQDRKDGFFLRRVPSKVANALIGRVTGVRLHDFGCSLKVYDREVVKGVRLYGELHRFIPAVASSLGVRWSEVPVRSRPRTRGESKYTGLPRTASRAVKVFLDLLTVRFLHTYATRPLHVFGAAGLLAGTTGFAIAAWLTADKLLFGAHLADRPLLLLSVLLMFSGLQLLSMGLLGEMIARTWHESQGKPIYAVREMLEESPAAEPAQLAR